MKSILQVFTIMLFFTTFALGSVNTRLVKVSNTYNSPSAGKGTLVIDVEAISDAGVVNISSFQDAFKLDAIFQAQNPVVSFSQELFPAANYTTTQDYTSSGTRVGRIRYIYTFDSGSRQAIGTSYTKIVRVSIEYDMIGNNGVITWYDGNPNFFVTDAGNGEIQGIEEPIPADLQSVPLPVELTTFSVTNKKGSAVDLKWETATEVNNYGFEVERSVVKNQTANSKNQINKEDRSWEKIGFIEGAGNSNSPKKYSFVDKNLTGGSHFVYRLKQVDVDGSFEYSEAIEIEVLPVKYELDQNYPNPFNPTTTIKFSLPQAGKVRLDVYNLLGELVTTLVNKNFEAGFQSVQFNASNLASGIYIYRLSSNSFSQVRKMMLLK